MKRSQITIRHEGYTIVELMIAMTIFLIVTASAYGVMKLAMQTKAVVNQKTNLTKSARVAMNLIGRETYNAGFGYPLKNTVVLPDNRIAMLLGVPADVETSRDIVPPVISGNNVTLNTFNRTPNVFTDQVTFLFKDSSFNPVGPAGSEVSQALNINAATTTGGIDEVVPISGSNAGCRINDIYLITGNTGSTLGVATGLNGSDKVQFANGDVLGFNQTGAGGPLRSITTPASMQRVRMITYSVTADGTLMRREFANASPVVPAVDSVWQPLVYGVEDFQIKYVMDDGSISDNPSAGPNGIPGDADDVQANLAAVRQVRFTLVLRTNELDPSGVPYRETLTSTFSTRNLGYDAN